MEIAEKTGKKQKSSFWSGFWFPVVFSFSSGILRGYVSIFTAWILAGLLATFISYFAESETKAGFVKYFLYIQACMLAALAALRLIPHQLREVIPEFWAYAVPALLLFNAFYFVPPLDGSSRGAWWKWVLGSFLFAGLYGWAMSL
ncbi:MAG TPA: hypothetical protein VGB00_20480 [Pyrinomonadaceae bacterium]